MTDLVQRLSVGDHPVDVGTRVGGRAQALQEAIQRGVVLVKFTGTRGGTELGVPIDRERSDFSTANFETGTGVCRLVGTLTLDDIRVRCIADIDLPSLTGQGRLEMLPL